MGEYRDICQVCGTNPEEDVIFNSVGGYFDVTELSHVRQGLIDDYQIELTEEEILLLIEEYGLDFGMLLIGTPMHEILYTYILGEL